jgi:hypothetical protein
MKINPKNPGTTPRAKVLYLAQRRGYTVETIPDAIVVTAPDGCHFYGGSHTRVYPTDRPEWKRQVGLEDVEPRVWQSVLEALVKETTELCDASCEWWP